MANGILTEKDRELIKQSYLQDYAWAKERIEFENEAIKKHNEWIKQYRAENDEEMVREVIAWRADCYRQRQWFRKQLNNIVYMLDKYFNIKVEA